MRNTSTFTTAASLSLLALASCASGGTGKRLSATQSSPQPSPATLGGHDAEAGTPSSAVMEQARAALGEAELASTAQLVSSQRVEWSDSSLGCPQPGTMYAQVITPGWLLKFTVGGQTHAVHATDKGALVCRRPEVTGAPKRREQGAQSARTLQTLVDVARNDLAGRLGVPIEEIKLLDFESAAWTDDKLGCNGSAAAASGGARVAGFKLFLRARGETYVYHTDQTRAIACPSIEAQ